MMRMQETATCNYSIDIHDKNFTFFWATFLPPTTSNPSLMKMLYIQLTGLKNIGVWLYVI